MKKVHIQTGRVDLSCENILENKKKNCKFFVGFFLFGWLFVFVRTRDLL